MRLGPLVGALLGGLAIPALADERRVVSPELDSLLLDVSLYGQGRGGPVEQIFQKAGITYFIDGQNSSQGRWRIEHDEYCSQWGQGQSWSCYQVTREGDTVTFVSASGARFPMSFKK